MDYYSRKTREKIKQRSNKWMEEAGYGESFFGNPEL